MCIRDSLKVAVHGRPHALGIAAGDRDLRPVRKLHFVVLEGPYVDQVHEKAPVRAEKGLVLQLRLDVQQAHPDRQGLRLAHPMQEQAMPLRCV